MTVRLSAAEAKALGIIEPVAKKRTTRKTGRGPYHTRCVACGVEFTTAAGESRHLAPGHNRFELLL